MTLATDRQLAVPHKWRPPLALIVVVVLMAVLLLPVGIVIGMRFLGPAPGPITPGEVAAVLVAFGVTIVIAIVFARTITGPMNALVARAEAIGRGGRQSIIPPEQLGTRELAALSQSLIDLATRLVDRTEYVSSFAAHVTHEFKSPLTAIRGAAELLRDAEMSPDERRRFVDHIVADADRLAILLGRLRELARADLDAVPGHFVPGALLGQLEDVRLEGDVALPLALPEDAARAVFDQLVGNARAHGATAVVIAIIRAGPRATVTVSDNGAGISPGNRERIFEPFFTTRREQGGTGMGLQIVRGILLAHGGSIRLLPTAGGASFELTIPLAV